MFSRTTGLIKIATRTVPTKTSFLRPFAQAQQKHLHHRVAAQSIINAKRSKAATRTKLPPPPEPQKRDMSVFSESTPPPPSKSDIKKKLAELTLFEKINVFFSAIFVMVTLYMLGITIWFVTIIIIRNAIKLKK